MANKKGVIETITEGLVESTRNMHQINKDNLAAVKADSKSNFKAATEPDPDFVKFKEAKGVGNKAKVVIENIKEGAAENSAKEKERRKDIQSHASYKDMLEDQRIERQKTIKGK